MATPLTNSIWSDWIARLTGAAPRPLAAFAPERFSCLLDELPLHLVATRHRGLLRGTPKRERLRVNPAAVFYRDGQLPPEVAKNQDIIRNFASGGTVAWIRDEMRGGIWPFWLGPRLKGIIDSLQGTGVLAAGTRSSDLSTLVASGVLLDPSAVPARCPRLAERQELFRSRGYCPVRDLIHPFQIAALRRYYRRKVRRGTLQFGDGQVSRRHIAHNDAVLRFFHQQIAPAVAQIVGEPAKPSYVYLGSYVEGAELKRHVDREQCEFSVTLCLDFSPEPENQTPWPIRLQSGAGEVIVYQGIGDALAYRGTKVPHYRSVLPKGQSSTSVFFHYVNGNFEGSLD